ncbi:MAG: hypothetical protein ACK59Y_10555 [Betaproteobacteria bacterium]|jgi:hypothetical protein|nr:hypothetical protein [Betaproteobacteria bacterium]
MEPWQGGESGDWDTLQSALAAACVSDGLPLVPPTAQRVAAMLASGGWQHGDAVALVAPSFETATAGDIAICAVLAGCTPDCFPVLVAAVEAIADPPFNLLGIATTTGSAAPLMIVNGPIAARIGLNAAGNALGAGARANMTLGRALTLILLNVCGARPGETDMATLGQPAKRGLCFAENSAESPWAPLHVERGFAAEDSVVTVVGIAGTVEVNDSDSTTAADMAQTFAQSMLIAGVTGGSGLLGGGEPLCLLPPEWAAAFAQDGLDKAAAKRAIWEHAALDAEKLPPALRQRRLAAAEPGADVLRVAERPEDLMIVVAGGVGRKAAYLPTWGGSTRAVSRRVRNGGK